MKTCSISDCESPSRSRGWCAKHYKRFRAHGDASAAVRAYVVGPQECTTEGCSNPKGGKSGGGKCGACYWRAYRATRREELDANYKAWRESKGSRWESMPEPERNAYRTNAAKRRAARKGDLPFIVTSKDIERLRMRQRECCAYCSKRTMLTIDHVMPLAAGGRHSIGNLALACEPCNKSKGSATVAEWKLALATGGRIPKRLYSNAKELAA